jgi:protein-disulfide isomerase
MAKSSASFSEGEVMSSKIEKEPMSKRQMLRESRAKKQKQQRLAIIIGIVGIVVIFLALAIYPTLGKKSPSSNAPITQITPVTRPKAQGTAMGDPKAPVKIDVFEDFQCPACGEYTKTIEPQVTSTYVATGKVYYTFHNLPFLDDQSSTKESHQAANASMCAADQGRFWDFHDMIYANQTGENVGDFSDERLTSFATLLGLDMNAFNKCFKANSFKAKIDQDVTQASSLNINGTPSVFVNGTLVDQPTFETVQKAVEAALKK